MKDDDLLIRMKDVLERYADYEQSKPIKLPEDSALMTDVVNVLCEADQYINNS